MNAPFPVPAAAHEVLAERRRQIEDYQHGPAADDGKPRTHLLRQAHVRLLDASDLVAGRATLRELQRARRKVIQAAALALAEIDRIDRQIAALPDPQPE